MSTKSEDREIRTVSDLVSALSKTPFKGQRLFRGQNTDKPLLPKIMRLAKDKIRPRKLQEIERAMLERFRREGVSVRITLRELNEWELLSVAQHQGMPTRFLDWTANALAALWFAVSTDPPDQESHGVVWAVDIPARHVKWPGHDSDVFAPKNTYFFQPPHLDPRIVAQSGWFSVYRHNRTEFLPLERLDKFEGRLGRFIVSRNSFQPLRQELRLLGISSASMFPDLSGLGADIQAEFVDSWRGLQTI